MEIKIFISVSVNSEKFLGIIQFLSACLAVYLIPLRTSFESPCTVIPLGAGAKFSFPSVVQVLGLVPPVVPPGAVLSLDPLTPPGAGAGFIP
jgi:hypothetical protein